MRGVFRVEVERSRRLAPSQLPRLKNLVMLYSLYLCGYEGVKFEIMHSLHNPLSAMQENRKPREIGAHKPKRTALAREAREPPLGAPFRIMHEYQPPGLAPE